MKRVFDLLLLGGVCCTLLLTSCDPNPVEKPEEKQEKEPVAFTIAVTDIATTGATVSVTPANKNVLYYFDVLQAVVWDDGYTDAQIADLLLEEMHEDYEANKDDYLEYYGITNLAEAYLSQGDDAFTFTTLSASTSYYAIAFAIDTTTMKVISELVKEPFTTTEVVPSDNQISFSQDAADKTLINITTTNDDPYIWTYVSTAELATDYNGDAQAVWAEYVELLNAYGLLDWVLSYGSEEFYTTDYFTDIAEVGDYTLIAAGYNGGQTTEIFTYTLTVTEDMIGTEEEEGEEGEIIAAPRKISAKHHAPAPLKPTRKIKK